jgi:hypothetical protein
MGLPDRGSGTASLADVVDRILDKGLIINADITISVVGVELLGIKIRAAVASFETAAAYGLEFPSGTRLPEGVGRGGAPALSQAVGLRGLPSQEEAEPGRDRVGLRRQDRTAAKDSAGDA